MKAKIIITPKKAVLDPQGQAVLNALEHMGYEGVQAAHVGRYLELEINEKTDAVSGQDPGGLRAISLQSSHRRLSHRMGDKR